LLFREETETLHTEELFIIEDNNQFIIELDKGKIVKSFVIPEG